MSNLVDHLPAEYLNEEFTISTESLETVTRGLYSAALDALIDAVEITFSLTTQL